MDPVGLNLILPELLVYLCLFLCEADIISLSHTCQRLRDVLNVNEVWRRFVTEEIKSLKTLKQQLNPPFHPDPNFCESRQLLLRRDHLISNWRNGHCVNKTTEIEKRFRINNFYLLNAQLYEDKYLLGIFDEDSYNRHHVFWNTDWIPELHAENNYYDFFHVIGDRFVTRTCCGVEVYGINLEDKMFPRLYNFLIEGDALNNYDFDENNCNPNDRCPGWVESSGGKYLIINKHSAELTNPVIHIWDIVNAKKFGGFLAPVICHCVKVHAFQNDTLILVTQEDEEENTYFKFDLTTKRFSDAVVKASVDSHSVLFYKDYFITMIDSSSEGKLSVTCKTLEFNSSNKIAERCFLDVSYKFQRKRPRRRWGDRASVIVEVDGKLVILCPDSFQVVDALSLDTLTVIPHEPNFLRVIGNISVFGTVLLTTVKKDGDVEIWDVGKETVVPNFACETFSGDTLWRVEQFSRDFCLVPQNGPKTKCVIVDQERITVTHFW